ncbi:MAG: hypothetical protein KDE27_29510, partial [Planctomycetes bacterium]|nr:hypothetical protein [Planctomycetota bacterium]
PGSAASVSGYSAHHRFCHFAPADGDGPLWFQIDRGGDWQLRVAARDGDRVQYLLLDSALDFRVTHGIGSGRLPLPATFHDGTMRALVPANCQRGELQVRLAPGAAAPPAMVLLTAEVRGDTEIDLASLTRVTLNVRGAGGEPVPFAQVAFGMRRRSLLERWMGNCVADESGRVDALVTPGASDLFAVAWADGAFGAAGVEIGDEPAEVAVVIAPLPHTDLHVVDAAGAPVSGARIAPDVQARALGDVDEDTALELCAAQQCCFALAMHARSGADGLLRIPIAAGWLSDVVIGGRGLRSEQFRLAVGRSREVVLR